jgi:hypothetical protein
MNVRRPRPSDEEWLRADQPEPPVTAFFQQRRRLFLGALAVALVLMVVVVGGRPARPPAKPASVGSSSLKGMPFFGLFPVFASDAGHEQVVLLNFRAQTWLWSNHQWVQAHPPNAPPGRTGAAVAWDPGMQAVLLFGGQASADQTLLHDAWAWNGSTWREVRSGGLAPPASPMSSMTYDTDLREMVLVESDIHFEAPIQLWTWNGVAWRERSVSGGPTSPVAAIGYEPRTRTVVALAGECSGFECRSQTWSWDGTTWRQLAPAQEPSFAFYNMALVPDPISGRLLLMTVSSNTLGPAPTETWAWDGRDWVELQLIGEPGTEMKVVATNGDKGEATVFAFQDLSRDFSDLRISAWEWTGNFWRPVARNAPPTP